VIGENFWTSHPGDSLSHIRCLTQRDFTNQLGFKSFIHPVNLNSTTRVVIIEADNENKEITK